MAWESEDERAIYAGEDSRTGGTTKSRRRICMVVLLAVALVAVLLAIIVPVAISIKKKSSENTSQPTGSAAISAACAATQYPASCNQTLSSSNGTSPQGFSKMSVLAAQSGVNKTKSTVLSGNLTNLAAAVDVCLDALDSAFVQLDLVLAALESGNTTALQEAYDDVMTRLSAAMEFHTTCLDAFVELGSVDGQVFAVGNQTNELLSNGLALVKAFIKCGGDLAAWASSAVDDLTSLLPGNRRRLLASGEDDEEMFLGDDGFPKWMGDEPRRHLLATAPAWNVKVASDGTGSFKTIQAAVHATPDKSTKLYVIYIKKGTYREQVIIPSSKQNVMFLGDGAANTVITGSRSVALTPNMTTFLSATLIVGGDGFLAKGITIQNTAGAAGHQAVAVRGSADKIAFYQCNIDSWQDTLYAHTLRQFYRECMILGTVDFIFGNSNSAFQNCRIVAKKTPLVGQQNTYTAQGKTDKTQTTGLSFQNCTFEGTTDLMNAQTSPPSSNAYKTYLGRPWKVYSTAVLLRNNLGSHIDPTGWLPWNTSSYGLYTSYFAEYQSSGPGAKPTSRVKWSKQITTVADANKWQAGTFIQANTWLPATQFPFTGVPLK